MHTLCTWLLVTGAALGGCRSNTSDPPGSSYRRPVVRHDLAPIASRVQLPPAVDTVTWWAEPLFVDSAWLETPDAPYRIVAWLPGVPPSSGSTTELSIALERAHHLLPEAHWRDAPIRDGQVVLQARDASPPLEACDAHVGVVRAAWLSDGLWLELYQRAE